MIQRTDCSIVIDTNRPAALFCVFEHQAVFEAGQPPVVVMVGACRLVDVYRLVEGKKNSEWVKIFGRGGNVMVRIIALTDDWQEAKKHAVLHSRSFDPMPRCNQRGFTIGGVKRSLYCDQTEQVYESQKSASDELGISASAISRHMRGELTHVGGYTFRYHNGE